MASQYEKALQLWGAQKLRTYHTLAVAPETVTVAVKHDPGYACCGGSDPLCCCSYYEPPSLNIEVTAQAIDSGEWLSYQTDATDFNFFALMRELSDIEIEEDE